MIKRNVSNKLYWRNFLMRAGLIIITVMLIAWFLPRHESKRYNYDVGKPWMYDSFIAKFDFPVYKTPEAIKKEQDSLINEFKPYYEYDADVETKQTLKFLSTHKNGVVGVPKNITNVIVDRLHRLYQSGIMNTPDFNQINVDTTNLIREIVGKEVQNVEINCIYSTMSAYEQLLSDVTLAPYRQILQRNNLNTYITPNLIYDKIRTDTERNDLLSSVSIASGMVISGQKIIDRGDIVNDYTYRVLSSFEQEIARRNLSSAELTTTLIGQVMFVAIIISLFTIYLVLFRKDYFEKSGSITMLYALITIFPILISLMMRYNILSVYIIPLAMSVIFIRTFMDSRTAMMAHLTIVLISATAVRYQYDFIAIQLVAGMVAAYSLREFSNRAQIFKTAMWIILSYFVVYFSINMMENGTVSGLDTTISVHFVINGILLLLSYPLMLIIEKTFGFISNVTLFELSNTNRGLLRQLSEIAPGTFQHSITVGNLASEIADKIHANSLLVRTGALYHDIGKMANPVFFTENQAGVNPHDNLGYRESAKIIIEHVYEGIKLADKNNIPAIIKDFILTHHGQGIAKYFYVKYQNEHPDEVVDKADFMYPGPNPFTREQAVLMMADCIEASSRSLTEYTEQSISELVNRSVDDQMANGFFTECPITFRDISIAKHIAIEKLMSIYHTRIQYPELNKG